MLLSIFAKTERFLWCLLEWVELLSSSCVLCVRLISRSFAFCSFCSYWWITSLLVTFGFREASPPAKADWYDACFRLGTSNTRSCSALLSSVMNIWCSSPPLPSSSSLKRTPILLAFDYFIFLFRARLMAALSNPKLLSSRRDSSNFLSGTVCGAVWWLRSRWC